MGHCRGIACGSEAECHCGCPDCKKEKGDSSYWWEGVTILSYINDRPDPEDVLRLAQGAQLAGAKVAILSREAIERVYGDTRGHVETWQHSVVVVYVGEGDEAAIVTAFLEVL